MHKIYSWVTVLAIAVSLLALVLSIIGIIPDTLVWSQFPLILLMVLASARTYAILRLDGIVESKVWLWLMLASFLTFLGDVLFALGNLQTPISIPIVTASSALMFGAYACFIIGLVLMGQYVRTAERKSSLAISSLAVVLFFGVAGFFLVRSLLGSALGDVLRITFIVYLLADFFLILANVVVVMRTMGGTLGRPYLILAAGCAALVLYQMSSLFMIAAGIDIFKSFIQALFVIALAILALGADARFQLQKNMNSEIK